MSKTTYRWTPERLRHRLFPLLVAGVWFAVWLSPPGAAVWTWLTATLPGWSLLPLGLGTLTVAITWGTIGLFHYVDQTGRPAFLARLKLQQPFVDPLRPSVVNATLVILRNHAILAAGIVLATGALYLRGWDPLAGPGAWWLVLLQLVAMGLLTEVLFFTGHRWLHTRWLYKHVHRVHHRYRAPTAWSAQYAHWFEYAIGNVLPIGLPMILVAPDLMTLLCFGAIVLLNTQLVHSGYQLPLAPWAVSHDLHHYRVTVNYGSTGLMDRIFGTRMARLPEGQDVVLGEEEPEAPGPGQPAEQLRT